MSAMRFRIMTPNKAFWIEIKFYKSKGFAEGKKHKRYRERSGAALYCSLLWRFGLEQRDGWYLARLGKQKPGSYEFKEVDQKRPELGVVSCESNQNGKKKICRKRWWMYWVADATAHLEEQGENLLQEKDKTNRPNDEGILMHANPLWRDQRCTNARLLDPRNQNKMKRMRAGVVLTSWDSLTTKWSGCKRWWESRKGWESLVSAAEELCTRAFFFF